MTRITRQSINGTELTQEIVNNFSVQTICVSPEPIREYFIDNFNEFDDRYSVVLFDRTTNFIYGYILTRCNNIEHENIIFQGRQDIIDYLHGSQGLYISDIQIQEEIHSTPIYQLLNTIHLTYCGADFTIENLYIWMNLNEVIWTPTNQGKTFFPYTSNRVSGVFAPYI